MPLTLTNKELTARIIIDSLRKRGYQALYAGGYVRDMLMGVSSGDIDIATNATPDQVARMFKRTIGVGEHFGVMIVVIDEIPFEVATFRSDIGIGDGRHPESVVFTTAEEDAQRRDFTINGLFYDPVELRVIDYVEGKVDIAKKIIRAIGDPHLRFTEDYLRLLRAIRFAVRCDFSIEEKTLQAIVDNKSGIRTISAERILQELDKMLIGPHPDKAIDLLRVSGLLEIILPEVFRLIGVDQPPEFHPEGDVYVHTLLALKELDHPSRTLAWATLLHDIGKPATKTITDRIRFNNHNMVGAKMAYSLLRRLKAPNELIECVCACIDNHMNFMNVKYMRLSTLKKFLARETLDDELKLHIADCRASHGDIDNYTFLAQKRIELPPEEVKPDPLLRGQDLLALGLKPGKIFGVILGEAYDKQLEGDFETEDSARVWLKKRILDM